MTIAENVRRILAGLPEGVRLMAAAKSRQPREIQEAIAAGVPIIGENYIQEAELARAAVGGGVQWHFIGHLQRNKVKRAIELFDMIETVDSLELGAEIDRRSAAAGRIMPVLVEVNSACEVQKAGALPEDVIQLVSGLASHENIRVEGLMTMGPLTDRPEDVRAAFALTRRLYDEIKALKLPNVAMMYLSMGMTDSYRIAIGEGANIVRIGTGIFGGRDG